MAFRGIDVPPHYRVLPPELSADSRGPLLGMTLLRIQSGAGFGVGTHETTQLCLLAMAHFFKSGWIPQTVLDFGAGSGILSVAAALVGAHVEAVEIDLPSIENARVNLRLNGVESLVELRETMSDPNRRFDLVVANILNRVLADFAEALCQRLAANGRMVLSGLVATDVPSVLSRYRSLLPAMRGEVYERGDWRAIVFQP